jgi:hypothetical protein
MTGKSLLILTLALPDMLIDLLVMGLPRWSRLESLFLSTEPVPLSAGNALYSLFSLLYPQRCPPIFLFAHPFRSSRPFNSKDQEGDRKVAETQFV